MNDENVPESGEKVPGGEERVPGNEGSHPKIDLSAAVGEAGGESAALGYEGVPDTGPVLREAEDEGADAAADEEELDALDAAVDGSARPDN